MASDLAREIALEVVEVLRKQGLVIAAESTPELLTAAQVAERFGVKAAWAREHADRLGAIRLGDGKRPRLRFDPERVMAALAEPDDDRPPERPATARRTCRQPSSFDVKLLEVKGDE